MKTFSSLDKQKLLINQDEAKREKLKILFEYYVFKMKSSMEALKDTHLYKDENHAKDDLVEILESNTNEFKAFLDNILSFEVGLLENFKKESVEDDVQ